LSQATSTFWDERVERLERVERVERVAVSVKANPAVKRRVRARRLTDAIILTVILAAAASCLSAYSRASAELSGVLIKHEAAAERVKDLTIKVEKLEHDVEQLRTDSRVIEQVARQKYGFVRSGEVVIKLPQESKAVELTTTTEERPVRVANLTPRASGGYTDASN
jgi:cell division protein FtsB